MSGVDRHALTFPRPSPRQRLTQPAVWRWGDIHWQESFSSSSPTSSFPTQRVITFIQLIVAAVIYVAAQIHLTLDVADTMTMSAYSVGDWIGLRFGFTAYFLCSEGSFPGRWDRVRDNVHAKADGSDNLPSNFPLTEKFWWTLDIPHSVRMVGWVQEPKDCLPPPQPPSRRTFLWNTF